MYNTNKWSKWFDKKGRIAVQMDNSIVFARWRQCVPHLTHASLGPPEITSQIASWLVHLYSSQPCPHILQWATPFPLKIAPSQGGSGTHLIHSSLGLQPKWHLNWFRSFLQGSQSWQTDRETNRQHWSVCNNRTHYVVLRWSLKRAQYII